MKGVFPQAAKSPPALRAGGKLITSSSHTHFTLAGVQEIPTQSYIVYLQAMEVNGDSGLGVGVKCVAPGVHLNEIFFFFNWRQGAWKKTGL